MKDKIELSDDDLQQVIGGIYLNNDNPLLKKDEFNDIGYDGKLKQIFDEDPTLYIDQNKK